MGKKRLGKKQWFDKALEVLAESGVGALKIERLAKSLGLSRNGFYWHFRNRDDLLEQLLEYWSHEFTGFVTEDSDRMKIKPEQRLYEVMVLVKTERLGRYDLAINSWAMTDPKAKAAVIKVTKMRFKYIRNIFKEMGLKGDELEARTRLFVCYTSWQAVMFDNVDKESETVQKILYEAFIE